ncbi:MAG: hypothetical protein AAEJ47_01300 [Planctomycetota bacterium]
MLISSLLNILQPEKRHAVVVATLVLLLVAGCQAQTPLHPNDVALAYLQQRAKGGGAGEYVAKNPGPVAAWADSQYPLPDPCIKIILDREMVVPVNSVGENGDQAEHAFRFQVRGTWKGLGNTILTRDALVVTENSFGVTEWPPMPGQLWYRVRYAAIGGSDGKDQVVQWLSLRPTAQGWKIYQRPEKMQARGAPAAEWSRIGEQ